MKLIFFMAVITSCTNLKHATSINFKDFKSFSRNASEKDYWDKKIKIMTVVDEKKCQDLGEVFGKDNAIDQGPEYAVLYMKVNADKLKADSIKINGQNKVGDYGNEAFGHAYKCESK